MTTKPRTPVYFLSHGGPTLMESYTHPAFSKLQEIGREITQRVRPKAVVVFSAHWQAPSQGSPKIQVNTHPSPGLLYDYYGFPPHFYEFKYPYTSSPALSSRVLSLLNDAGIPAEPVKRGLDHGVFSPFRVAFDPEENPLGVPIVQVSIFERESARMHLALGKAVRGLREEGVLIVVSGMAVHNVREHFRFAGVIDGKSEARGYTISFDEALKEAVETVGEEERGEKMVELLERGDARSAHPTFEHILPVHVGAGAAGEDAGVRLWTLPEGSLSWAQYRFGEVGA